MPSPESLVWYRATTLAERLAAEISFDATASATEDDLTRYRLQSWKAQPPFDDGAYFAQRLTLDGLTETQLRSLLVEPLEAVQARFPEPPTWLSALVAALTQSCPTAFELLLSDHLKSNPTTGFLVAAAPFLAQALAGFEAGITALTANAACLPFDPTTIKKILFAHLPEPLLAMLNRALALELNIARLSGELAGATAEARFQSFITRLDQPDRLRSFLQDYPVLARLLLEQTQRWVNVSLEFLTRLCRDWEEIKAVFVPDGNDPGVLVAVKGGVADTHRGGQSVLIARFSSGFSVVYKPKSLGVDAHFQQLLQWMNARGADPAFPTLKVLKRATYGWVEHVTARECQTTEEVQRFYHRQGGYLALLYLLDATDFHAGNLIACGEFPFLIDLEALFHPHRSHTSDSDSADKLARRAISHSVLRLGLLPERVWGNSENDGIDTSGLGTVDDQLTPHALPQWEAAGTDTMHLVRKRKPIRADKNRPRLAGGGVNVLDYQDEILAGFADTYALLQAHRDALQASDGPLACFAEDEVCVFLRSMRTYRRLLRESFHPDVLRDALDRDRLFDLLWVEVKEDPDLLKVIQVERDDLLRGDIPLFTTRPASRDLWINADERLPDFFAERSLTVVQRRLRQLSRADYERQSWFIRASLATLPMKDVPEPTLPAPASTWSREQLLAAAQLMGDRLEQLAIRGVDDASWLGLMQEPGRAWFIDALGFDLDAGLPGVALFLAHLGKLTGQEHYTALAQATLTTMQRQMAEWGDEVTMIGAFDGWGGVIYTLTHLGVLWQRPDLIADAEAVVDRLPELIAEDDEYDVYGGAAGCIAGLRCLAQAAPSDRVTAVAIQCGDHLLMKSSESKQGQGFARGTTGIAWALLMLHHWTGIERFRAAEDTRSEWEAHIRTQAAAMRESYTLHGWRCRTPLAVETPGLLSGLAGIGYELLRLAEPELVPSVLALEPPVIDARTHTERSRHGATKT
jgi:type 2 lantibiotic biosynthesis protein LanM